MQHIYYLILLRVWEELKLTVKIEAARRFPPVAIRNRQVYDKSRDVSVIVPTIAPDSVTFRRGFSSWYRNQPREIIVVTTEDFVDDILALVEIELQNLLQAGRVTVRVLSNPRPSKRKQMARGIVEASGKIIVLCDDDTIWPAELLPHLLTCFEDSSVGGVGTLQEVRLPEDREASVREEIAARRLRLRNLNIISSNYLDGGVTCLSGRTAAYRSCILKNESFLSAFMHDMWKSKYLLDSGDDTFITRWLFLKNWAMKIQSDPGAIIETVPVNSAKVIKQLLRWSRNGRRNYLRCLFGVPNFRNRYPFLVVIMVEAMLQPMTAVLKLYLWFKVLRNSGPRQISLFIIANFIFKFTRARTMISEEERCFSMPRILTTIASAVTLPFLNMYVYATLDNTDWGSRDLVRKLSATKTS